MEVCQRLWASLLLQNNGDYGDDDDGDGVNDDDGADLKFVATITTGGCVKIFPTV